MAEDADFSVGERLKWRRGSAAEAIRRDVSEAEQLNPQLTFKVTTTSIGTTFSVRLRKGSGPVGVGTLAFPATVRGKRGAAKFRRMQETGRPAKFFHGEFEWETSLRGDLLASRGPHELNVKPRLPRNRTALSLSFDLPENTLPVPYAELSVIRHGTKELATKIVIQRCNVELMVTMRIHEQVATSRASFKYSLTGLDPSFAAEGARILHALASGASVTAVVLETGSRLFIGQYPQNHNMAAMYRSIEIMMRNISTINSTVGSSIKCPFEVLQDDIDTSQLIVDGIANGEVAIDKPGTASFTFPVKDLRKFANHDGFTSSFSLESSFQGLMLCGETVDVGRVSVVLEHASLDDPSTFMRHMIQMKDEENISFAVRYGRSVYRFLRWAH